MFYGLQRHYNCMPEPRELMLTPPPLPLPWGRAGRGGRRPQGPCPRGLGTRLTELARWPPCSVTHVNDELMIAAQFC